MPIATADSTLMRYQNVCLESIVHILPPHVVTSDDLEQKLSPVYDRLSLPYGRLELMTGIRERRFFDPGTLPGQISVQAARMAIDKSGVDRHHFGALVHGSVCRDQMEPATAASVHAGAMLPPNGMILDVSNACLGLLNGMLIVANLIESGQIQAGVVVGTETGRDLVEGTIDSLLSDDNVTRNSIKSAFASLTIGSGSAAIVLCDRKLSRTGTRVLGGAVRNDTTAHNLCAGGVAPSNHGDHRPRMETDSEALLHAGVDLAAKTWQATREVLSWSNDDVDRVFTHQVGRAHRKLLLDRLELESDKDSPTVEYLGNTGAVALPVALSVGAEDGRLEAGHKVALLGIGSGLSAIMLGLEWGDQS